MSNEQGILNRDNAEQILRGVNKGFFKGGFSKLGSGHTKQADPNGFALTQMNSGMSLGGGEARQVQDMEAAYNIVKNAEQIKNVDFSRLQGSEGR